MGGGVIAFLPLFVGCSPENDAIEYENSNHHHAKKISFEEFSNNQNALRSFKKIEDKNEARKSSRIIYDSINHFYIDTEKIMLSEENGQSYYTFLIHRDYETSKTENLVLRQDESGQFSPLLFEYAFSEQDIENINLGGSVGDVESKTVIKQPAEIGLDGIFGNVNKFTSNCQTVTISWCSSKWSHAGGYFSDGTKCDAYQEVSWDYCEGGNGGANTDPGYTPQPTQNPYTPHQGGQSGWGSTAGNNNPNQYIFTVPLVENWTVAQNKFIKGLSFQQRAWLMDSANLSSKNAIFGYLITNQFSEESCDFVEEIINFSSFNPQPVFSSINFPGMEDGMPFEWWKDEVYITNNFTIFEQLPNAFEIILFNLFPDKALLHVNNSLTALSKASELYSNGTLPGIEDGKADAFRHAYWNALDTAEFGGVLTKLFTDAHEAFSSGLPKQMDLHNNLKGREKAEIMNFNFLTSDSDISSSILIEVYIGHLVYIVNGVLIPTN